MSNFVVQGNHTSWYEPGSGQSHQNIASEAFQNAVNSLKKEVGISTDVVELTKQNTTIHGVLLSVQQSKHNYDHESKEHLGTRVWLEKLSCRIMYYGKVFDSLAQHHPEYVALAWGSVKIILIGIMNRATLVQKLAQAFVAIGDVLPRADLSADLYQTGYMRDALCRLYTYIIYFLQLCMKWYNRSPLGRLWSAIKSPFELEYQDLVDQIKVSSDAAEDLANAGARAEIRDIRTIQGLHHTQFTEFYTKLTERQAKFEASMTQLMRVATSSKTLTENISVDVRGIVERTYRIEFHHLVQHFAPQTLPEAALLKVRSLTRRNPTASLPAQENSKIKKMLQTWASVDRSSFLVIRMSLRAHKQARELVANVVQVLASNKQCVFWNLSLPSTSARNETMADVFKTLIYQILEYSPELFKQSAEQLNLVKVHGTHTDGEWVDLLCLLFSKIPRAFIVIETDGLHKTHQQDADWADRLLQFLQKIVDRTTTAGNRLKILLVVYGKVLKNATDKSAASIDTGTDFIVTSLRPPALVPPRFRHVAQRSGFNIKNWKLQRPKI